MHPLRIVLKRPGMDAYPTRSPDGQSIAFITTDGRHDWETASPLDLVHVVSGRITHLSGGFDEKIKG